MMDLAPLITVKKCAELYGISENAIRQLMKKGQWRYKVHFERAPTNRIFIRTHAVYAWIERKEA